MEQNRATTVRWRPEPGAVLGFEKGLGRTVLVPVHDLEQRLAKGRRSHIPATVEAVIGRSLASEEARLAIEQGETRTVIRSCHFHRA